jgi:hypothetical protein
MTVAVKGLPAPPSIWVLKELFSLKGLIAEGRQLEVPEETRLNGLV